MHLWARGERGSFRKKKEKKRRTGEDISWETGEEDEEEREGVDEDGEKEEVDLYTCEVSGGCSARDEGRNLYIALVRLASSAGSTLPLIDPSLSPPER